MSSRASDTTPGKSTNLNTANCPPSTATAAAALNLQDARVQVALNAVKLELEEVRVAFKDVSSLNGDVQSLRNELAELRRDREEQARANSQQLQHDVESTVQRLLAPVVDQLGASAATLTSALASVNSALPGSEGRLSNLLQTRFASVEAAHKGLVGLVQTHSAQQVSRVEDVKTSILERVASLDDDLRECTNSQNHNAKQMADELETMRVATVERLDRVEQAQAEGTKDLESSLSLMNTRQAQFDDSVNEKLRILDGYLSDVVMGHLLNLAAKVDSTHDLITSLHGILQNKSPTLGTASAPSSQSGERLEQRIDGRDRGNEGPPAPSLRFPPLARTPTSSSPDPAPVSRDHHPRSATFEAPPISALSSRSGPACARVSASAPALAVTSAQSFTCNASTSHAHPLEDELSTRQRINSVSASALLITTARNSRLDQVVSTPTPLSNTHVVSRERRRPSNPKKKRRISVSNSSADELELGAQQVTTKMASTAMSLDPTQTRGGSVSVKRVICTVSSEAVGSSSSKTAMTGLVPSLEPNSYSQPTAWHTGTVNSGDNNHGNGHDEDSTDEVQEPDTL